MNELPLGVRRFMTVMFVDLAESTRIGEEMDAEPFAALMAGFRHALHEVVPRYGGRIARIQGDGALALFGYPQAGEDDGRRATEAALDLREAVKLLHLNGHSGPAVEVHTGIHAGLVYVVDGDVERGRFDVIGRVPNAAARLCSHAGAGEICVSQEALGPDVNLFLTSGRELLALRGLAARLVAYKVDGRSPVRRRYQARALRGLTPFLGRGADFALLRSSLAEAEDGQARLLTLTGGPGIGKTRLAEEFCAEAEAHGHRVLRGYCVRDLGAEPLQPFLHMLRESALSPAQFEAAVASLHAAGSAAAAAARDLLDVLRHAPVQQDQPAPDRALILAIDDWQWADEPSQRVLDALLPVAGRVLLLLTLRSDSGDLPPLQGLQLQLGPLAQADANAVVASLMPGADPFIIDEIVGAAGGNALFIEELCHAAQNMPLHHAAPARPSGPAWLSALIESRLDRLPARHAQAIRACAVIGNIVPLWLLQRLIDDDGNGDGVVLRDLVNLDLLKPSEQPGHMRFKHGITRDVVYEAIHLEQRLALHLRIADALEAPHSPGSGAGDADMTEQLALHCAGGGRHDAAARHAEAAGDKAMAAHALDRARAQYSAALDALDALEARDEPDAAALPAARLRWCALAAKLGMACVFDPLALADGEALFERGVQKALATGDDTVLARAEYWLGYICYSRGRAREALLHCARALGLADRVGDARLAAQVRATLGQALATAGRYDEALLLLDTAVDSKRARARPGGSVAVGSAFALACKGSVVGDRGLFGQAQACFDEALELLGDSTHPVVSSVRNWVSVVHQWQGRWGEAVAMAASSVRVAEQVKSRQLLAMSRSLWAYADWMHGGNTASLQLIRDSMSWIEDRRGALVTSLNYGWLVDSYAARGLLKEARRDAARLLLRARQHDRLGEAMGCRALARAAAAAREHDEAERYLRWAERSATLRGARHEEAKNLLCRAEIDALRGRAVQGRIDAASELFEAMQMGWHLQQAAALRARL